MKYIILISAIVLIFCSCADNSNSNLEVFRISEAGFRSSSESISNSTTEAYSEMVGRSRDPQYSHTEFWMPVATQIHEITTKIGQYINTLKDELKNEAGIYKKGETEIYHEENTKAVSKLVKAKGKQLFDRLINYRKEMLSVDSSLANEFENKMYLFSSDFDYTKNDESEFIKTFFKGIPAVAAMAVLSKFENDIKINENNFTTYCLDQTYRGFQGYRQYVPLITQSSKYLKAGDELEITAGIGSYSVECRPEIMINGKNIQVSPDGAAVYKFKTIIKAGKYYVPIKLQYTLPDGRTASITKSIEYTVIDPNQNPQ